MGMRIAWQSANGPRARGYGWKRMVGCGWMDRWMGRRWCMDGWALQVLRLDEIQMHSTAPAISTNELILPPARFFFLLPCFPFHARSLWDRGCCISLNLPIPLSRSFRIYFDFPNFRLIVRSIEEGSERETKTARENGSPRRVLFSTITSLPLLTKRPFNLDIISRLFV